MSDDAPRNPGEGSMPLGLGAVASRLVEKTVAGHALPDAIREQYRKLATGLHQAQAASGIRTVVITSAVPEEGKSLTASNLAITLAESFERRVLLVDADLRRPSLHELFSLPVVGPGDLARRGGNVVAHPVAITSRLSVLAAGSGRSDPTGTLLSERTISMLAEGATQYDWVLVDTPPIALLSDAQLLAPYADGALIVVAAGRTPCDLVQRAVDSIGRSRVLGVVLNLAEERAVMGGYDYQRYYGGYYGRTAKGRD